MKTGEKEFAISTADADVHVQPDVTHSTPPDAASTAPLDLDVAPTAQTESTRTEQNTAHGLAGW